MALADPTQGTTQRVINPQAIQFGTCTVNVGETERLASIILGTPMTIFGLIGKRPRLLLTLFGASLLFRGITGRSFLYQALGVSTVKHSPATIAILPDNKGFQVKRAVTIDAPAEELYSFWHDFQNLPRFMVNIESVQTISDGRSHWIAKTPSGKTVEWTAVITQDEPGRFIAWRRIQGPLLAPSGGSVHFEPKRNGRETVVWLEIEFRQFPRQVSTLLGNSLGQIAQLLVRKNLERFKELMETGEIPTTEGQPSGQRI